MSEVRTTATRGQRTQTTARSKKEGKENGGTQETHKVRRYRAHKTIERKRTEPAADTNVSEKLYPGRRTEWNQSEGESL